MSKLLNSTINGVNNTNATAAATAFKKKPLAEGSNVFVGHRNSSNALGYVGPHNFSITAFPIKVRRCDQIILLSVNRITEWNDYCKKSKGFFTMSVYMVNMFENKDGGKLVESISLDKASMPMVVPGAPNCIHFDGPNLKRIGTCFDTKDQVDDILGAYKDFLRCRMGDNLKGLSMTVMDRLLKLACTGKKLTESVKKDLMIGLLKGDVATIPGEDALTKNATLIAPYYKDLKVPGSF